MIWTTILSVPVIETAEDLSKAKKAFSIGVLNYIAKCNEMKNYNNWPKHYSIDYDTVAAAWKAPGVEIIGLPGASAPHQWILSQHTMSSLEPGTITLVCTIYFPYNTRALLFIILIRSTYILIIRIIT
ncbi:MAG: hypothetical protein WAK17_04010 [Candidatus Nitrosopolaris sp.]|jgi:hypothetical protein